MEQRGEPRIDSEQTVRVITLGEQSEELPARIANLSGTGLRLLIDRHFPAGATLRIEWDQILLFGEVRYCQSVDGGYTIGVELEHALLHTHDLSRLARKLLGDADSSWNGHPQAAPVRKRRDR
jgi:PilZ domain